jgi:uncharacterized protein (DUF1697 family)
MSVYIALLRGINVGGKNMIKMADLKKTFESLGLKQVQTYIQSGNVLFLSQQEELPLRKKIESGIESAFGFKTAVVLRTAGDLEHLIQDCPFSEKEITGAASPDYETLYTALLTYAPDIKQAAYLDEYATPADRYIIIGRDVYLLLGHSIRDSKLATNLHRLDATATVRNYKTMRKLTGLAMAMHK